MTQVQGKIGGKKIPNIIKKLNKALGPKAKSEKLWDILFVSELKDNIGIHNITGMAANINKNEANINKNTDEIEKYHPKISK